MSRTVAEQWITDPAEVTGCDLTGLTAEAFAALVAQGQAWLYALSGGRVGTFTTVEECYRPPGGGACGLPYKDAAGRWRNNGGGDRDHCCRIEMARQPVRELIEVRVYGEALSAPEVGVEGNTLVRYGACWPWDDECDPPPVCADYRWGTPPDAVALAALSALLCELNAALAGDECALPAGAQRIVRQGVTVERPDLETLLDNGLTGMPLVDQFVRIYNPARLQARSRVMSPDLARRVD